MRGLNKGEAIEHGLGGGAAQWQAQVMGAKEAGKRELEVLDNSEELYGRHAWGIVLEDPLFVFRGSQPLALAY